MNVSSGNKSKAFHNLLFVNVCALLKVMQGSSNKDLAHLKRRYSENSQYFNHTLSFLNRLGIIKSAGDSLVMSGDEYGGNGNTVANIILNSISGTRNRYRTEIFKYISRFGIKDNEMTCYPSALRGSGESDVRNFLMEMGIIRYEADGSRYILSPDYMNLYAASREGRKRVSPSSLTSQLMSKDAIGFAAEKAIIDYEVKRLGKGPSSEVDHVARRNTAAGYDIRSLTKGEDQSCTLRFIEVKAVPKSTYRFYWSSNEVSVARELGRWYYLYLLPVRKNGSFDMRSLKIISDPIHEVLVPSSCWITAADVIECSLPTR